MKKVIFLTLVLFIGLSGIVYAADRWNGFQVMKVLYGGKELKATDAPPVSIKGRTFVPLYMLRDIGLGVSFDGKAVTVTLPPATAPEKPTAPLKKPLTEDDIKLLSNRAVALVYALDDQGNAISQGSAFVVSSDGLLLTAQHVAEEKGSYRDLKVILNGKTYTIPKDQYIHRDAEKDIYLTRLPKGLYDYIPFNATTLKDSEIAYALGFPKGISTVVKGEILTQRAERVIFRKMFVDHGTSGGALINQYGEAVGIIVRGAEPKLELGDAVGGSAVADLIK
jgi:S1-C subfamily serine protease